MIRAFPVVAVLSVSFLLAGCPPQTEEACGTYESMTEALDLTGCNETEVAAVERTGIWHGLIRGQTADGGTDTIARSMRMIVDFANPADPKWDGESTYVDDFSDGRFFMRQRYQDLYTGTEVSTSVLGCRSASTGAVTGLVEICATNVPRANGTFELTRLATRAGEGASSGGVTLIAERKISEGNPTDVTSTANHVFVTTNSGVSIFRLSNNLECGRVGAPQGDYWTQSVVIGNMLYVASLANGIFIYDLGSDPCTMVKSGEPRLAGELVRALYHDVDHNLLFVASSYGDVIVLDVTNVLSPWKVSQFRATENDADTGASPIGMFRSANRLYVNYGTAGYVIFDLPPDLSVVAPAQLGAAIAPDGENSIYNGVLAVGDKTYALESSQGWNGHVRVLDVTNPTAAVPVASFALRPEISVAGMDLLGTKLYLAYSQDGLRIVDVADPTAPSQAGHYNTWDPAKHLGASYFEGLLSVEAARDGSGRIYGVDTARGLMIFDETP